MEESFVLDEVRQPQLVDEEDVTYYKEVEVGSVGWQENDGNRAVFLDFSDLFEHLHVDVDPLIKRIEQLVQSVGHCSHC